MAEVQRGVAPVDAADLAVHVDSCAQCGLRFKADRGGFGAVIGSFAPTAPKGALSTLGLCAIGDVVARVNGRDVTRLPYGEIEGDLTADAPAELVFRLPQVHHGHDYSVQDPRGQWRVGGAVGVALQGQLKIRAQSGLKGFRKWNSRFFVLASDPGAVSRVAPARLGDGGTAPVRGARMTRYKDAGDAVLHGAGGKPNHEPRVMRLSSVFSIIGCLNGKANASRRFEIHTDDGVVHKYEAGSDVEARLWVAKLHALWRPVYDADPDEDDAGSGASDVGGADGAGGGAAAAAGASAGADDSAAQPPRSPSPAAVEPADAAPSSGDAPADGGESAGFGPDGGSDGPDAEAGDGAQSRERGASPHGDGRDGASDDDASDAGGAAGPEASPRSTGLSNDESGGARDAEGAGGSTGAGRAGSPPSSEAELYAQLQRTAAANTGSGQHRRDGLRRNGGGSKGDPLHPEHYTVPVGGMERRNIDREATKRSREERKRRQEAEEFARKHAEESAKAEADRKARAKARAEAKAAAAAAKRMAQAKVRAVDEAKRALHMAKIAAKKAQEARLRFDAAKHLYDAEEGKLKELATWARDAQLKAAAYGAEIEDEVVVTARVQGSPITPKILREMAAKGVFSDDESDGIRTPGSVGRGSLAPGRMSYGASPLNPGGGKRRRGAGIAAVPAASAAYHAPYAASPTLNGGSSGPGVGSAVGGDLAAAAAAAAAELAAEGDAVSGRPTPVGASPPAPHGSAGPSLAETSPVQAPVQHTVRRVELRTFDVKLKGTHLPRDPDDPTAGSKYGLGLQLVECPDGVMVEEVMRSDGAVSAEILEHAASLRMGLLASDAGGAGSAKASPGGPSRGRQAARGGASSVVSSGASTTRSRSRDKGRARDRVDKSPGVPQLPSGWKVVGGQFSPMPTGRGGNQRTNTGSAGKSRGKGSGKKGRKGKGKVRRNSADIKPEDVPDPTASTPRRMLPGDVLLEIDSISVFHQSLAHVAERLLKANLHNGVWLRVRRRVMVDVKVLAPPPAPGAATPAHSPGGARAMAAAAPEIEDEGTPARALPPAGSPDSTHGSASSQHGGSAVGNGAGHAGASVTGSTASEGVAASGTTGTNGKASSGGHAKSKIPTRRGRKGHATKGTTHRRTKARSKQGSAVSSKSSAVPGAAAQAAIERRARAASQERDEAVARGRRGRTGSSESGAGSASGAAAARSSRRSRGGSASSGGGVSASASGADDGDTEARAAEQSPQLRAVSPSGDHLSPWGDANHDDDVAMGVGARTDDLLAPSRESPRATADSADTRRHNSGSSNDHRNDDASPRARHGARASDADRDAATASPVSGSSPGPRSPRVRVLSAESGASRASGDSIASGASGGSDHAGASDAHADHPESDGGGDDDRHDAATSAAATTTAAGSPGAGAGGRSGSGGPGDGSSYQRKMSELAKMPALDIDDDDDDDDHHNHHDSGDGEASGGSEASGASELGFDDEDVGGMLGGDSDGDDDRHAAVAARNGSASGSAAARARAPSSDQLLSKIDSLKRDMATPRGVSGGADNGNGAGAGQGNGDSGFDFSSPEASPVRTADVGDDGDDSMASPAAAPAAPPAATASDPQPSAAAAEEEGADNGRGDHFRAERAARFEEASRAVENASAAVEGTR